HALLSPLSLSSSVLFSLPRLPRSTLFPYTTLFRSVRARPGRASRRAPWNGFNPRAREGATAATGVGRLGGISFNPRAREGATRPDRKSTRLNSSHVKISYAVFCLKKKNNKRS